MSMTCKQTINEIESLFNKPEYIIQSLSTRLMFQNRIPPMISVFVVTVIFWHVPTMRVNRFKTRPELRVH